VIRHTSERTPRLLLFRELASSGAPSTAPVSKAICSGGRAGSRGWPSSGPGASRVVLNAVVGPSTRPDERVFALCA